MRYGLSLLAPQAHTGRLASSGGRVAAGGAHNHWQTRDGLHLRGKDCPVGRLCFNGSPRCALTKCEARIAAEGMIVG